MVAHEGGHTPVVIHPSNANLVNVHCVGTGVRQTGWSTLVAPSKTVSVVGRFRMARYS